MYSLVSAQWLHIFLAPQIFIPICQQQVSVTSGDKVLFMLRYPIFTCLTAFLKDDALENKMQHLSLFGWLREVELALLTVTQLVHRTEPSQTIPHSTHGSIAPAQERHLFAHHFLKGRAMRGWTGFNIDKNRLKNLFSTSCNLFQSQCIKTIAVFGFAWGLQHHIVTIWGWEEERKSEWQMEENKMADTFKGQV